MDQKLKKILKYAVSLAVAAVLLWFSFRSVKWDDFIAGLGSCRWEFIVLSMAAGILAFYLRSLRWRELLLPIDSSLGRKTLFNAVNIGYIANFVFPRIGEFVRCGVVSGHSAQSPETGRPLASYDRVLGTVVLERSWDMVTMLLFLCALLVARWDKFGTFFMDKMLVPVENSVDLSLGWVFLIAAAVAAILVFLVVRFRNSGRLMSGIYGVGAGLLQGVGSCLKMPHKWKFFTYTALIWGMYWLMSLSTMWALPDLDGLGAVDALFLMVAGSLGWVVPVPGGFGAFHFIVSLALSTIYGIPFGTGIIFATLSHESQAITMAVCGGLSYFSESMSSGRKGIRPDAL